MNEDFERIYTILQEYTEIAAKNVVVLDPEHFTMIRKNGIGASDSSAVLGTMSKFRTAEDVLNDKLTLEYTANDRAISEKPVVKMGRDLEPLVLDKAAEALSKPIYKIPDMMRVITYPYLTINYDGIMMSGDMAVPVEAKVVSTFGDKYYGFDQEEVNSVMPNEGINAISKRIGIPPYYYVQVQHQLLGTNANYAYLAALRVKTWDFHIFKVPEDPNVQKQIIMDGHIFWRKVERNR